MAAKRRQSEEALDHAVQTALSSFESEDDPSPDATLRDVRVLIDTLKAKQASATSQQIPFNDIRHLVRTILSQQPPNPQLIIAASVLYIQLVHTVSLAYEELSLSTCIHSISTILKDSHASEGVPKRKQKSSSAADQVKQFYVALLSLIKLPSFDTHSPGFVHLAVSSFTDLIRHGRVTWTHEVVIAGMKNIFDKSTSSVTPALYKVLFPIVRAQLSAQSLSTIAELLVMAGKLEQQSSPKPMETSSVSDDSPKSPFREVTNVEGGDRRTSSGTAYRQPLVRFLALSAMHTPDRAEQRSLLISLFTRVVQQLGETIAKEFMQFVLKASRHPKARVRLFAVEYAASSLKVAVNSNSVDAHGVDADAGNVLDMLSERMHDKAPSVRVKAISALTDAFQGMQEKTSDVLFWKLVKLGTPVSKRLWDSKSRVRKAAVDYVGLACKICVSLAGQAPRSNQTPQPHDVLQQGFDQGTLGQLIEALKQRNSDSVSNVRLATIVQMNEIVTSISNVTTSTLQRTIVHSWCDVILPHVEDVDSRCKEASLKAVEVLLFSRGEIASLSDSKALWNDTKSPESLSDYFLEQLGGSDYVIYEAGRKAVAALSKAGNVKNTDIRGFVQKLSICNERENSIRLGQGLWAVLGELAENGQADAVIKMLGRSLITKEIMENGSKEVCKVGIALAERMTLDARTSLFHSLRDKLFSVNSNPEEFSTASVSPIIGLMSSLQCSCCPHLIIYCERLIADANPGSDEQNEKLLLLIGSVFDSFAITEDPSQELLAFINILVSNSTQSSKTRALALVTLGKICLCQGNLSTEGNKQALGLVKRNGVFPNPHRNTGESLTRRYISIFVHELDNPTSIATRNNAVVILCDLCRQYTAVAEPYVGRFVTLLGDSSEFVRIQVMTSVVSLLQEDYIKLRTSPIFFRLALCLLDSVDSIRTTAEYAFLKVIASKNPYLLATSFIELIFVLNDCSAEHICNRNNISTDGESDLKVVEHDQRMRIYKVFLQGMSTEQRFKLPGRLRSEILCLIADEKLSVSEPSVMGVILDTLELMASNKVGAICTQQQQQNDGDNDVDAQSQALDSQKDAVGAAGEISKQQSLLAKVYSLELREVTIPALLELRQSLEQSRSPLLKVLMKSLCSLLRPYQKDLKSIIRDATVRSEIAHEMSAAAKEAHARKNATVKYNNGSPKHSSRESSTGPSQVDAKVLSVPRQKRPRITPRLPPITTSDSEGEERCDGDRDDDGRSRRLSMGIDASPKLAAIATRSRGSSKPVITVSASDQHSSFAIALARIEDAAEDKDS